MTTVEDECPNEQLSQAEELKRLNTLFAKRYTNEDDEYKKMAKPQSKDPPIIPDWDMKKNNYPNGQRHLSRDGYNNRRDYQQRSHSNDQFKNHHDQQQRHHSNDRHHHQRYDNRSRDNSYSRDRSPTSHYHQNQRR